jgi:hypothetical protein
MPTFFATARFWNDYDRLTAREAAAFQRARAEFMTALAEWEIAGFVGARSFDRACAGQMAGYPHIRELTCSRDGRCTWQFGESPQSGKCHVIWRRIGSHAIYDDP